MLRKSQFGETGSKNNSSKGIWRRKKKLNSLDFFGGWYLISSYLVNLSRELKIYKCKTQICKPGLPPPGEEKRRKLIFQ